MTDSYVGLVSSSSGDKKIDNSEVVVGANTVQRQRINISDPLTAGAHAAVLGSSPASSDYGLTTRPLLGLVSVAVSTSGGALPVSLPGSVGVTSTSGGPVNVQGTVTANVVGTNSSGQLPAALSSGGYLGVAVLQSTGTQAISGSVGVSTTSGIPVSQSGTWSVGVTTTSGIPVSFASGAVLSVTAASSGFGVQVTTTSGIPVSLVSAIVALSSGTVVVGGGVATSAQLPSALSSGGLLSVAILSSTGTQAVSGSVTVAGSVGISTTSGIPVTFAAGAVVGVTSTSGGPVNVQNAGTFPVQVTTTSGIPVSGSVSVSAVAGAVLVTSTSGGPVNVQNAGTFAVQITTTSGIPVNGVVALSSGTVVVSGLVSVASATSGFNVADGGGSLTVDGAVGITTTSGTPPAAMDLDASTSASDVRIAFGLALASTDGTGAVAARADSVGRQYVADGGGSLTVDGAVGVTSTSGGAVNIQDNGGSITVDNAGGFAVAITSTSGGALTGAPAATVPAMVVAVGLSDGTNSARVAGDAAGNVKVRAPGNQWRKTGTAVAATLVSINSSAQGGTVRNVCQDLAFSVTSTAAPTIAGAMTISVFDGTSSGTAIWSLNVTMPAVAGQAVLFSQTDLWIEGSQNTALTFFCATPWAACIAKLSFGGCTIPA